MAYREELKNRINEFIESQTGNICVSLFDLKEQDGFSIDGDRRVPSASMIKLVIMAELMRPDAPVIMADGASYRIMRVCELLPYAFDKEDLNGI